MHLGSFSAQELTNSHRWPAQPLELTDQLGKFEQEIDQTKIQEDLSFASTYFSGPCKTINPARCISFWIGSFSAQELTNSHRWPAQPLELTDQLGKFEQEIDQTKIQEDLSFACSYFSGP